MRDFLAFLITVVILTFVAVVLLWPAMDRNQPIVTGARDEPQKVERVVNS